MDHLLEEAKALHEEIVAHRRWLHAHAETRFELTQTIPYVRQQLEAMGYQVKQCGKAGLVTCVGGSKPGKVFLLRADMDALPMAEESGEAFASPNGKTMHACGHDMHTAMLLGAARLLKNHEQELCGTVKLMFQAAEETFEGAADMIANGVLEDPKPDAALMIHVTAGTSMPTGMVIVSAPGVSAPAADYFTITVQGKGCHGSAPQNGVDALTAAAHILLALQEIHARELPASEEAVLTVGTVHGGSAPNVIADSAVMQGTIRTYDEQTRAYLKQRMEAISTAVASAYRATASVSYGSGCPTLVNDQALSERAKGYLSGLLDSRMIVNTADFMKNGKAARGGGSEDFAYISQRLPALMLALSAGNRKQGYEYSQHHPKVRFDENALPIGAAVLCRMAQRWLEENRE